MSKTKIRIPDELYIPDECFVGHNASTNEYTLEAYDAPAPPDDEVQQHEIRFLRANTCLPEHVETWMRNVIAEHHHNSLGGSMVDYEGQLILDWIQSLKEE